MSVVMWLPLGRLLLYKDLFWQVFMVPSAVEKGES